MKNLLRSGFFAFIAIISLLTPSIAWAYSYGGSTMNYTYSGSITSSDCSNPARGAGYYGDLFKVSSSSALQLYLEAGSLGDPYIQVLGSDRISVIGQDDDSGGNLNSYLTTGVITTSDYVVATTYGQGAEGTYTFYSNVPLTQVFSCPQAITFNQPGSIQYGSTLNVTANTNMSLPVTMTSQTPSICSVSASAAPNFTISALLPGTCTLQATQAGDGSSEAATPVSRSFTVSKKNLGLTGLSASKDYDGLNTATITGTPSITGVVGSDSVAVSGTPSGTFATANAGSQNVNISGLSLTGAQASYYQLPTTFIGTINKINQTLSWSPTTILLPSTTGQNMAAATTTAGGGAITYSVQNAGTTGCSVSAGALSFTGQGNCVVRATAASNTNYNVATQDVTFVISKLNQILSWSPTTSFSANPSTRTLEAATTSGSGVISYSVVTPGTATCSVSGLTLSFISAGTCRVKSTAAATTDYNADSREYDFNISTSPQTVTWNPSGTSVSVAQGTLTPVVTPSSTGSGAISYSVTNQGTTDCSVNQITGVITFSTAGICIVRATAAQTSTESSAYEEVSFTITPLAQTVTWSPTNTSAQTSQSPLLPSVAAFSSGNGAISYSLARSSGTTCRVNSQTGEISFSSAGSCTVRATAAATNRENSAYKEVDFTFTQAPQASTPRTIQVQPTPSPSPSTSVTKQTNSSPSISKAPVTLNPELYKNITSSSGVNSQITFSAQGLPELLPLQSFALINNLPVSINVIENASKTALNVIGEDFEVIMNAISSNGTELPLSSNGTLLLQRGNQAVFSGNGFAPNSEVAIWLFSTPKFIGTVSTDSEGKFEGQVDIPKNLDLGEHTLQLNGTTASGETRSLAVGVEVEQAIQNSPKQTDNSIVFISALGLIAAITVLLLVISRRRVRR